MPKRRLTIDPGLAREAKGPVALAFRNGPIEDVHAGRECPTCAGKTEYSRITDAEMKNIMKNAVDTIYKLLWMFLSRTTSTLANHFVEKCQAGQTDTACSHPFRRIRIMHRSRPLAEAAIEGNGIIAARWLPSTIGATQAVRSMIFRFLLSAMVPSKMFTQEKSAHLRGKIPILGHNASRDEKHDEAGGRNGLQVVLAETERSGEVRDGD